jgi:hypothetical protein
MVIPTIAFPNGASVSGYVDPSFQLVYLGVYHAPSIPEEIAHNGASGAQRHLTKECLKY